MTYSLADLLAMARRRGDTELVKRLAELIEKKGQTAGKLMGETSAPENASNEGAHVTSDAVCNAGRERATDAESRKAGPQPEVGRESSGHCWNPNCFYREELAWAADKLLRASGERDALLRWLDEQIRSEREWGGIAGNAAAYAYEDVKAHIEGRDK